MASLLHLIAAAALLTVGCARGTSGVVRDAATEHPIAGAVVEIRNYVWGIRGGQLVWDAEKVSRATTDGDGHFRFDVQGGVGLGVSAAGYPTLANSSLCAHSPMIIRIGGPYSDVSADQRLVFEQVGLADTNGKHTPSHLAIIENLVIRASGGAFADEGDLRIATNGGVRFVPGTGVIPRPPPLPYDRAVELHTKSDCGWLFVSNGTSPIAVINVGPLSWEQEPGKARRWVMLYSDLSNQ